MKVEEKVVITAYKSIGETENIRKAYNILSTFQDGLNYITCDDRNYDIVSATTGEVIEKYELGTAMRVLSAIFDNDVWNIERQR